MQQKDNALIIFIKNPVLGKVKTRLAATLGDEKALQIYIALQEKVRTESTHVNAKRQLYYSDYISPQDDWDNALFSKHLQVNNEDLGERMHQAITASLQSSQKVVLIGSDIAQISTQILEEAFQQLEEKDVVIGPALDGGYYLIGMKHANKAIFENITWSTKEVYNNTLTNIKEQTLSVGILPTLSDIDYPEDWEKYGWLLT